MAAQKFGHHTYLIYTLKQDLRTHVHHVGCCVRDILQATEKLEQEGNYIVRSPTAAVYRGYYFPIFR